MAFVPNFTAGQTIGNPSVVSLTDTHTGTDAAVTQRRAYLYKQDNTTLVPSGTSTEYVQWALASSSISIDALDTDYALNIKVDYLDVSDTVLYTITTLYVFTLYNEQFYYELTQSQSANNSYIFDTDWYMNKMMLRVELDSANQAVSIGGSIGNAQACLNRASYLRTNSNLFF